MPCPFRYTDDAVYDKAMERRLHHEGSAFHLICIMVVEGGHADSLSAGNDDGGIVYNHACCLYLYSFVFPYPGGLC